MTHLEQYAVLVAHCNKMPQNSRIVDVKHVADRKSNRLDFSCVLRGISERIKNSSTAISPIDIISLAMYV